MSTTTPRNLDNWRERNYVAEYATRDLRPVEVLLLARHREALSGRVLELGCGAGRVTGYLQALGGQLTAIDLSERMVAHSRQAYPGLDARVGDVRDLSAFAPASFDAVVAACNLLDALDHEDRLRALRAIAALLAPGGLFITSAHNRAHIPSLRRPRDVWPARNPVRLLGKLVLLPHRERNHRRMVPFERQEAEYALVNDDAHDFTMLHYYIGREAQERQLADAGLTVVEVVDREGKALAAGDDGAAFVDLHYVARRD